MILYHGSFIEVSHPDIVHSRKNVDFGVGFYTTPLYEQAEKWCKRYQDKGRNAYISVYELDEKALEDYEILRFESYSEEWLDFIMNCRSENDTSDYDVVMGGVANDKVFNTVELYMSGLIDKQEAIGRLKYEKPNYQLAFRTQRVIDAVLCFKECEKL